jgi:hypothetical protein
MLSLSGLIRPRVLFILLRGKGMALRCIHRSESPYGRHLVGGRVEHGLIEVGWRQVQV